MNVCQIRPPPLLRAECREASGSTFVTPNPKLSDHDHDICSKSTDKANCKVSSDKANCKVSSPVGRLRKSRVNWEKIGANSEVSDVIENGYKLPLFSVPNSAELKKIVHHSTIQD